MRPASAVCDTGPVLHLHEAGALDLLSLIDAVQVPPAVDRELLRLVGEWSSHRARRLQVVGLDTATAEQAARWTTAGFLHRAEAEALALALQVKASWFLTDDTAARELAKSL
jgi:predicted nucleic acid-binding protein